MCVCMCVYVAKLISPSRFLCAVNARTICDVVTEKRPPAHSVSFISCFDRFVPWRGLFIVCRWRNASSKYIFCAYTKTHIHRRYKCIPTYMHIYGPNTYAEYEWKRVYACSCSLECLSGPNNSAPAIQVYCSWHGWLTREKHGFIWGTR